MQTTNLTFTSLKNAHGPIPYSMTNDYMFRAVLQSNNFVLRGLIGSLLHLYSDNFILSVIDLNQINLATEADKLYQIDYWATLFKATT